MAYVFLDPADYIVGKPISFEEYAQLVENANEAYDTATAIQNHGEIFATRAAVTTVNTSVSGSVPGPYTWPVPAGITQIIIDIVGGGGGGSSSGGNGSNGTASTVTGSTSGSLATANPGLGGDGTSGAGGTSSGFCKAGNTTTSQAGAVSATPFHGGDSFADGLKYLGWFGGYNGIGTSGEDATGYGNGGGNISGTRKGGGGAAAGSSVVTVVPGETLTITPGSGGPGAFGGGDGSPGAVRIRF